MQIGLTGARGVLGRRMVDAFEARGQHVSAYGGDVRDMAALGDWMGGCTQVVHAAAVVPTVQVKDAPGTAIAVNVAGTANVAAAATAVGAAVTYISTSHVYASSAMPLAETAHQQPVSLYGLSKWQGEQWVERLTSTSLILRIFSYFDSRQAPSFLVPALYRRIREAPVGASLPLFGYRSVRDIADATWLANGIADLVLAGATGTLNLGTGIGETIAGIAARLSAVVGRSDIEWVPADDHTGDTLVADIAAMRSVATLSPFDLDIALRTFATEMEA